MITESRFAETLREMGVVEKRCSLELKVVEPGTDVLTYGVASVLQALTGLTQGDTKIIAG